MSKTIDFFFTKKKTVSELPSSSNDFFNQKLIEASEECENARENEVISGSSIGDNQSETREINEEKLKKELDEAKKEIIKLKKKVSVQKEDIKLLKHSLNASNRLCVLKDIKIERLIKEIQQTKKSEVQPFIFNKFETEINASTLKDLRSVPTGQKNDSTFILKLVRYLYENNHNVLLDRSVAGINKTAITPKKKKIIQDILQERVTIEEEEEVRIELRTARVGTLISDAIRNIVRPLKKAVNDTVNPDTYTNTSTNTNATAGPPPLVPISKKRKLK